MIAGLLLLMTNNLIWNNTSTRLSPYEPYNEDEDEEDEEGYTNYLNEYNKSQKIWKRGDRKNYE